MHCAGSSRTLYRTRGPGVSAWTLRDIGRVKPVYSFMMTSLRSRVLAAVLLPAVLCALSHAGEDADFRKAHGYYTLQEYTLAIEAFDAYLKENPKAERAEQARLLLAEGRYQLKHYKEASANYALFLKDYPLAARRPEALLRAVKVNFLLKEHEKSLAAAENFLKENSRFNKE